MSFGARCACDAGLEGDVKGLYRFGIEEEYFLADAGTRDTPSGDALERFHAAAQGRHSRVEREMLASQVEGSTPPFTDFAAARDVLSDLRSGLAATAQEHGLLVFAAGTHPVARWLRQNPTSAKRYEDLARELGQPARRNVVGGLHVHVEVPRPEQRVDHMNRLLPYLPLLLSLSASSPLWQGVPTGLAAYRLSVFGEMPRSGLPEFFSGIEEYERFLDIMISSKAIPDASYLWWYVRPALRYPTLELRVTDSCTYLEDALAIAALWRCLVRLVDRRPDINSGLTGVSRAIVAENLWRAQRDGVRAHLIDEATGQTAPVRQRLAEVIADVEEDAHALGCRKEMEGALLIAERGTSADQQMRIYEQMLAGGRSERDALAAAVDWLAAVTARACNQTSDPRHRPGT